MWCFGLSATFGDRVGFIAEGDDKEKVSVLMSLQELISIGKGLGYSGAELQLFVRDEQDRQGKERQLEREARRGDAEREARREQAEREVMIRKEEACSVFYSMVAFVLVPGLVGLLHTHAQHMLSSIYVFSPPLPYLSHLATASALPISCVLCVRVCATNIHNTGNAD